jgi:hypothetical protein
MVEDIFDRSHKLVAKFFCSRRETTSSDSLTFVMVLLRHLRNKEAKGTLESYD